jgi:hypothetical protein
MKSFPRNSHTERSTLVLLLLKSHNEIVRLEAILKNIKLISKSCFLSEKLSSKKTEKIEFFESLFNVKKTLRKQFPLNKMLVSETSIYSKSFNPPSFKMRKSPKSNFGWKALRIGVRL